MNKWWNVRVGSRGVYSSGISEAYTYYTLYIEGIIDMNWYTVTAGATRDFSSQISSGIGEYQYIDVNKGSLKLELSPLDFLTAGGEYYMGRGDSEYKFYEWDVFLRIGPESFNLECAYGTSSSQYFFNTMEIEVERKNASFDLSGDITKKLSADITYERNSIEFSNLGYQYNKNTVRAGIFYEVNDAIFISAGVSGGNDSADYTIVGADGGIFIVMFDHVRLSCIYLFEQYLAPSTETTNSPKKGTQGSGGGSYGNNPYLQSSKVGESISSHRVSLGIVYSVN